jgi:acyl-CoA thioester hydrolase
MILHPAPDAMIGEARLRVRYAETEKMGVVYNSNYLIWFEIGRVELMRELGHSYREMEEDGYLLPVAEVTCRFKGSAAYDDQIVIHTNILKLRRSLIQFGYQVFRESDNKLSATGASAHLVVDRDKRRKPLSDKYMVPFARAMGGLPDPKAVSE